MAELRKKKTPKSEDKPKTKTEADSLYLIHGEDDFQVAEEARRIIALIMPKGASEFGLETIEGAAANQTEAAVIFKRLFESLRSQSFFATERVVWWRNTNLLGSNSTASSKDVSDFIGSLGEWIEAGLPTGIRLVITATELDGRKGIAKVLQKSGKVISFKTDPYKQQENQAQAADFAIKTAKEMGKALPEDAAVLLAEMSGGDRRTIHSEVEKLATYVGDQKVIGEQDIQAIGSWRPGGVIWDLPDAVGRRDLQKALEVLNDLLFLSENPIALLFAIITRIRLLLLLSVLVEKKLIRANGDYSSFKAQMDRLPSEVTENLPQDKKLNPLAAHPFVLWKAVSGTLHYHRSELQGALKILLEANERLVSSGGDPKNILEGALLKICVKK